MGGGHDHGVAAGADRRPLVAALAVLLAYLVAEVVAALLTDSLALLSDAGHLLTDVGALAIALWAIRVSARPASDRWTYGWQRVEILSALANAVVLLMIAVLVTVEAVRRLVGPSPSVDAGPVLAVALVGVAVNVLTTWLLARADRRSLNVRGAYLHLLTDLYGFIGTAVAAVVILLTGWDRADAVASLLVAALLVRAGWGLLVASCRVLLQAAPDDLDLAAVREHLQQVEQVRGVHDLHVWTLTSGLPVLSAHLVVDDACFSDGHAPQVLDRVQDCLGGHFDVAHSTFQLEPPAHAAHEHGAHD